jgi:hypothetical protein
MMNNLTMLKRFAFSFLALFLLTSCEKSDQITLVDSTGRINNILIVINNADWDGRVGDALKTIIGEPVVGLPQEENQFSVNQVDPLAFNSLFKRHRNILFVGLDTISHFYMNQNVFASPQTTLTILGKDKDELIENIRSHKEEIISVFKKNDLAVYQQKITKDFYDPKNSATLNNLGIAMKIPFTYKKVEDNGEFLWYRYDFDRGLLNLIAYEVPLFNDSFTTKDLVSYRDSIGKYQIPGQFENTYMRTEPNFTPITKDVNFGNINAIESRGLWFVEGDYMGGPFISYTIRDIANQRLIVVEGFSYSPSAKKRDFVFELEAILKTVTIN